jgi:hypothetical protein
MRDIATTTSLPLPSTSGQALAAPITPQALAAPGTSTPFAGMYGSMPPYFFPPPYYPLMPPMPLFGLQMPAIPPLALQAAVAHNDLDVGHVCSSPLPFNAAAPTLEECVTRGARVVMRGQIVGLAAVIC